MMLDVTQLDDLARACHKLLAEDLTPETVANTYLHPLNAHPSSLARYDNLNAGGRAYVHGLRNRLAGAVVEFQGTSPSSAFNGDTLPHRTDILFISHLLQPSQAREGQDLYYGTAPIELNRQGISTVTALINHTGRGWQNLAEDWVQGPGTRVVLARRHDRSSERIIGQRLVASGRRLARGSHAGETVFARKVRRAAAANAASTGSRTALRTGLQIEELVRRLQPKAIVTTYEGHSWERLAFWHARKANPDIICVGYHHALLFPNTTAMTDLLGRGFDPNRILTAGDNTRDWLRAQTTLIGLSVDTLGSVRVPGAVGSLLVHSAMRQCLIIPEGTIEESLKLISVAAAAAKSAPDLTFRIRLHPLLQSKRLQRTSELQGLPANMVWSDTGFDDDVSRSRWVLYRGSTAVISAILAGLKPIYLDDGGVVIDPLRALTSWRSSVADATQLLRVIKDDIDQSEHVRQARFEAAAEYCRLCFGELALPVLQSLIQKP